MSKFAAVLSAAVFTVNGFADEPNKQKQAGGVEEGGAVTTHIGTFTVGGKEVAIYPSRVGSDYQAAKPFVYYRPFVLTKPPTGSIYDDTTRTLRFDLISPPPSDAELRAGKQAVYDYYGNAQEQTTVGSIPLTADQFVRYDVRLSVPGRQIVLDTVNDPTTGTPALLVRAKVEDDGVRAVLKDHPELATVEVRPFYRVRQTEYNRVIVTQTQSAVRDAFEKVFGKNDDPFIYATRDALTKFKDAFKASLSVEVQYTDPAAVRELIDLAEKYLKGVRPATAEELRAVAASAVVYSPGQARVEISPNEFRQTLDSLTTSDKLYESFEETWQTLHDLAKLDINEQEFFNRVSAYTEKTRGTGASARASLFGGFHSGGGSYNSSFWEKTGNEALTTDKKKQVAEFKERMAQSGGKKGEMSREAYKSMTGEIYESKKQLKNLDFSRVEKSSVSQAFTGSIGLNRNVGSVLRPIRTQLDLARSDFLTDQQRFDALFAASKLPTSLPQIEKMLAASGRDLKLYKRAGLRFTTVADRPGENMLRCATGRCNYCLTTKRRLDGDECQRLGVQSAETQPQDCIREAFPDIPETFGNEVVAVWLVTTELPNLPHQFKILSASRADGFNPNITSDENKKRILLTVMDAGTPAYATGDLFVLYRGPEAKPAKQRL